MSENQRKADDLTLLGKVTRDAVTSFILLISALVLERVKTFFGPEGPPFLTIIILNLGELILLLSFLAALIRALVPVFIEFDRLLNTIQKTSFWQAIRAIQFGRLTKENLPNAVVWGLNTSFIIVGFSIFTFILANSPIGCALGVFLTVILIVFTLYATIRVALESGPLGSFISGSSFLVGLLAIFTIFVIFIASIGLIFRLTGHSDIVNNFLNVLLSRR